MFGSFIFDFIIDIMNNDDDEDDQRNNRIENKWQDPSILSIIYGDDA